MSELSNMLNDLLAFLDECAGYESQHDYKGIIESIRSRVTTISTVFNKHFVSKIDLEKMKKELDDANKTIFENKYSIQGYIERQEQYEHDVVLLRGLLDSAKRILEIHA